MPDRKQAAAKEQNQPDQDRGTPADGSTGGKSVQYDLEEIWTRIFEEGEDIKGSFNLIRTGAVLAGISDEDFKVIAHSEFIKEYVEANQSHICRLMEKITGKKLKLICRTENQEEIPDRNEEMEKLAREVSDELHIKVRVE